jgi:flagellar hook-length control protein FliK
MMQCTVKFFEVPAPKNMEGACSQKVAVKMSAKDAAAVEDNSGRFAEMMAALMALPQERMDQSLPQVGWVPMGEGAKEWVPLIDLSHLDGKGFNMLRMLMKGSNEGKPGASMFHLKMKFPGAEGMAQEQATKTVVPLTGESLVPPDDTVDQGLVLSAVEDLTALELEAAKSSTMTAMRDPVKQMAPAQNPAFEIKDLTQEGLLGQPGKVDLKSGLQQGAADMPAQLVPAGADESESDALKAAVANDQSKTKAVDPFKINGHHENRPASPMQNQAEQVAKNPGGNPNLMQDQPNSGRKEHETSARQRVTLDADGEGILASSSSDSPTANGSQRADALAGDGAASFQSHLKTAQTTGAGTVKGQDGPVADDPAMQTDVIRQIVQRMTVRTDGNMSQMQIKLKPEFLGNMNMEIMTQNQQIMIRMTAENHKVKDMIEQNIHVLRAEMQQHGLQVQKIDVFVSQDQDAWKNGHPQTAFQQTQQRDRRQGGQRRGQHPDSPHGAASITTGGAAATRINTGEVDFFA